MNTVYLLASIFLMTCAITFFAIFVLKENLFWSSVVGITFLIAVLLFVMSVQAWRAPAMNHKAQLVESGVAFIDGYGIRYIDCNLKVIQRRVVIKDAMDYTYWEVAN